MELWFCSADVWLLVFFLKNVSVYEFGLGAHYVVIVFVFC